jgi:Tol biopolymer transport system component
VSDHPSSADPADSVPHRLDSWKDIASYLKRDVSTVQRWEKREGMPVHRHLHDKLGSVYAFPAELDAWWQSRQMRLRGTDTGDTQIDERATDARQAPVERLPGEDTNGRAIGPNSALPAAASAPRAGRRRFLWLTAGIGAVALAGTLVWLLQRADYFWQNPVSNARFVRVTDFEGAEHAAAISPDGRFIAFLADRDGPEDVWVTQVGTGQFHNLTRGRVRELVNPDVRTIGFSPDATLVSMWIRRHSASHPADIGVWAVPTLGGEPRLYLEGVAEFDWSSDGTRIVYHTPGPGDPTFVNDHTRRAERKIFTAPSGLHSHFPVWSPDDAFIYFVYGAVPNNMDIWRIDPAGGVAERMTSHNSRVSHPTFLSRRRLLYLATDADGAGPWLYALDVVRRKTRRISFGVERYTSLAGSADGQRLVVTMANPKRTLWRMPITDHVTDESAATRVTVPTIGVRAPRLGQGYLLYVSSGNHAESIWKLVDGTATELWNVAGGRVIGGPAIAPDGRRIAFSAEERGRTRMYVMNSDGSAARTLPESLEPQGAPAWAPDGQSIAVAATINGAPCLAKVSVDGQTFVPLVSEVAADPAWSPDGASLVYSGPDVGTTFQIRVVSADGRLQSEPNITLSRGARRLAFLPGQRALLVLRGEMNHKNFWVIDLESGRERPLTNFGRNFVIGDFDVSADRREIVFDREQDNSDIVLIDR